MRPSRPEAVQLFMRGSQALADIEANGIRIDTAYLDQEIIRTGEDIKRREEELKKDDIFTEWRKVYGSEADLGSPQQLGRILFDVMGIKSQHFTASKDKEGRQRYSTSAEALEKIDLPFVSKLQRLEKIKKVRSTYLIGVRRETVNGFLHPFFHLHLVITFRSSSSQPNFQNQPNRDEEQAKSIRQAFIPRDGHVILEIDYGAMEFRGAACFWRDPAMVAYASDSTLDIHRDIAAECFKFPTEVVTKEARFIAKSYFVFATLYGSYWKNTGPHIWDATASLKTAEGTPIRDHLAGHGIRTKEQFVQHIKGVEDNFNNRFSHWSREKDVWWQKYLKQGWFELMTGFVCSGLYSRNQLMNTPIQGPSFHCLLWSLIELNDWLKRNKMRTMITGQIHDSIFFDCHKDEFEDVIAKSNEIMTKNIREEWPWIIVPLEIECEYSEENWYAKREYKLVG